MPLLTEHLDEILTYILRMFKEYHVDPVKLLATKLTPCCYARLLPLVCTKRVACIVSVRRVQLS